MSKQGNRYAAEFRRQMVELVRAGRGSEELAREFEPSGQTIRNWVNQADLDEGRRRDGLTSEERAELRRLREPSTTVGAGEPLKSRGLVRSGDRVGTTEAFRFVRANQDSLPVPSIYSSASPWVGSQPCGAKYPGFCADSKGV